MSEWQPIETAPKDGAWVMAYSEDEGPVFVNNLGGDWYTDGNDHWPILDLTHWQPLPEPPK
jgi:hypothetical protein